MIKIILYALLVFVIVYCIILYKMHKKYETITQKVLKPPSKEMYLINNFFPQEKFNYISNYIVQYYKSLNVRNDNFVRKGGSFSHQQMISTPLEKINDIFDNLDIISKIKKETGLTLNYIPKTDPNRLGVLIYQEPKDGIDWHYDGNNYYGNRWVGIYTVKNRSKDLQNPSKSKFEYILDNKEYSFNSPENSLVLFRGDKIKHKVSSLGEGEIRIVVSLLFCDICERKLNPIDHIYQSMVNLIFYGKM